jgi:thioredoxin:protein disulfide reductase
MRYLKNLLLAGLFFFGSASHAAVDFLDPEVAFKLSVTAPDAQHLKLQFDVAPGYHLYRDKLNATVQPDTIGTSPLEIPQGVVEFDPTFNKNVELFKVPVTVVLPLARPPQESFKLVVGNQGCADQGLCYPPMERAFRVDVFNGQFKISPLTEAQSARWSSANSVAPLAASAASAVAVAAAPATGVDGALQSGNLFTVVGAFFIAGLLLSFTPCVLPMIPILSSIIVGQGPGISKVNGLSLAAAYSLGLALVYTALGIAAGLAGESLAAQLQNAWVLGAFALLLATLSLSMFGAYELQMPSSLQTRLTQFSNGLKGGQYLGVFVMGVISALIVGPCVAAPLAGALVYIGQTRNVVLGGSALFAMACGMSVPLLLLGVSAGSLLPRVGGWMQCVKHFFGFTLLSLALWMVSPVVPAWALMIGAALLLLAMAVYLGAFERLPDPITPAKAFTKGTGLMLALFAALQLVGASSGANQLLQPLQHWASGTGGSHLAWQTVPNLAALDAAVAASKRPVMVDFYADWCVACKELEALTFSQDKVRARLEKFTLLRVDVTANNEADKALMRKYQLFGPPGMLFFTPQGSEISAARLVGFQSASTMAEHLDKVMTNAAF